MKSLFDAHRKDALSPEHAEVIEDMKSLVQSYMTDRKTEPEAKAKALLLCKQLGLNASKLDDEEFKPFLFPFCLRVQPRGGLFLALDCGIKSDGGLLLVLYNGGHGGGSFGFLFRLKLQHGQMLGGAAVLPALKADKSRLLHMVMVSVL